MKVIGVKIKEKDKEIWNFKMENYIKEHGTIIKWLDLDKWILKKWY